MPDSSPETNDLTLGSARPLSEQERKAADRDVPVGERVFAPASKRVAVAPVPGHGELTEQTDTHTPERQAAGQTPASSAGPAVARVAPPSEAPPISNPSYSAANDARWNSEIRSRAVPVGMRLGWVLLGVGGGIGGWLFLRWQRERNRPMNRLRRQALQAASELRDRVPSSPEEAVKPAAGLTTALISLLIILYQQSQARSRQAEKDVHQRVVSGRWPVVRS